jgi:hypothetical protein
MGFFDKIGGAIGGVFEDVVDTVEEVAEEVIDAHDDVFDGAVSFVSENPEVLLQAGGAAFGIPPTGLLSSFGGGGGSSSRQRSSQVVRRVATPSTKGAVAPSVAQPIVTALPSGGGFFEENKTFIIAGGIGFAAILALIFATKK